MTTSANIKNLSGTVSARKPRAPKPGEVYQDPESKEWLLLPKKYNSKPVRIDALLQVGGLPRRQGDKVTLWFFRDPPEGHRYWTDMHDPGVEIDYSNYHIALDYGRYFFRKQDALKNASTWDTGKVVGLMSLDLDRLMQNGQFKRNVALKTKGRGASGGTDVTSGPYLYVKGKF